LFDATPYLSCLAQGKDVVVKSRPTLPLTEEGSDIDIYTLDSESLISSLLETARRIKVDSVRVSSIDATHFHVDIMEQGRLLCKLDLYSALPTYRRFSVSPGLFSTIVGDGRMEESLKETRNFPTPRKLHEGFIRYLEYCEFFWIGPDKLHHYEWILSHLTHEERGSMFMMAHRFINYSYPSLIKKPKANPMAWLLSFLPAKKVLKRLAPRKVVRLVKRLAARS